MDRLNRRIGNPPPRQAHVRSAALATTIARKRQRDNVGRRLSASSAPSIKTDRRYFVHDTTWYLHEKMTLRFGMWQSAFRVARRACGTWIAGIR
jgi:hypothetical protein